MSEPPGQLEAPEVPGQQGPLGLRARLRPLPVQLGLLVRHQRLRDRLAPLGLPALLRLLQVLQGQPGQQVLLQA